MKFLQKLGKSLMLPVACLPICGILMGLGYWMCPATMQGGEINGIIQQIGFYLVKAGGALIDNMAILFAIGIGVGMADDNDGTAALSALASWLMITNLLSTANVFFELQYRGCQSAGTSSDLITTISSGSLWFRAYEIRSGGMEVSESNTATFPRACTPESVLLAPMTVISSPVSFLSARFRTSSTVIPFGWICHPQ